MAEHEQLERKHGKPMRIGREGMEPLPEDGLDTFETHVFPNNISFVQHNILSESSLDKEASFDIILALSVSKWIHLNWGDEGIKKFFLKIHRLLKPDGCFILEPQEFKGYKRRKFLSPNIKQNYENIKLKPNDFINYLTKEVGFRSFEALAPPSGVNALGFKRNIYKLIK
eukprot:gene436-520_t